MVSIYSHQLTLCIRTELILNCYQKYFYFTMEPLTHAPHAERGARNSLTILYMQVA